MAAGERSGDSHASGLTSREFPSAKHSCLGQKHWRGATGCVAMTPCSWRLRSRGGTRLAKTSSWPHSTASYGRPRVGLDFKRGRTSWRATEPFTDQSCGFVALADGQFQRVRSRWKRSMSLKIIVSGAGVAGLALAHWLGRIGATTILVERAPHFQALGHSISLKGNGVEMVRRMGILDACRTRRLRHSDRGGWSDGGRGRSTSQRWPRRARRSSRRCGWHPLTCPRSRLRRGL